MVAPSARAFLAAVAVCAALGSAREASAYCRTTTCDSRKNDCPKDDSGCPSSGAPLSWRELPLTFRFSAGGSDKLDMDRARGAIRAAFDAWSSVKCDGKRTSLRFKEGPEIKRTRAKESFGIYFRDDAWPYDDSEESLALTNQTFGLVNGFIDTSTIEINTNKEIFSVGDGESGFDLQAVVTHEVGHYIGLAHSRVPGSIMQARYCQTDACTKSDDALRALGDDDTSAVCALYPPGGIAGVRYEEPPHGCSASSRRAPSTGALGIAAAAAGVALRRRRAPRRRG